jgi:hypothetical protein
MRIYYAHALITYRTQTEKAERKQITARFPKCEIIDPGEYEGNIEKTLGGMEYCFQWIRSCDALIFSRLKTKITAGVGREINYALRNGVKVYELHDKRVKSIRKPVTYLSRKRTRRLYSSWRLEQWRSNTRKLAGPRDVPKKRHHLSRAEC